MTLIDHHRTEETSTGGEALIREARLLRRRRWIIGLTILSLVLAAIVVAYAASSRSTTPPGRNAPTAPRRTSDVPRTFVPTHSPDLIQPTTLAAEHDGDVLILDSSRDQILQLAPEGTLSVFAGIGRQGFSGDGGLAIDAELDFGYFSESGVAVAPNGTVYLVDDGNCRLRAVNPRGIIHTIVRVPLNHLQLRGTSCSLNGIAVSPSGAVYVSTNSEIKRVTPRGTLAWVAGTPGAIINEPTNPTPSTIVMSPESIAFDARGDLDISSSEPRVIYQLSPSGKITNLGAAYATQLTTTPEGNVLAGTHAGEIDLVASKETGVEPYRDVVPSKVDGLNWGSHSGFQENGIAVTSSGVIYVDNAQGNGYGKASVIVRIATNGKAEVVPIRTPVSRTLPGIRASGFPASLYPAPSKSATSTFASCPNSAQLEPFTPAAIKDAKAIAANYQSSQYASDLPVMDRSWWAGAFVAFEGADLGVHSVTAEKPAEESAAAKAIGSACGETLVRDSIAVSIGTSIYSNATGVLYLLNRDGHPLVYYAVIANNY